MPHRHTKLTSGRHTTLNDSANKLANVLETWTEVKNITIGMTNNKAGKGGAGGTKVKVTRATVSYGKIVTALWVTVNQAASASQLVVKGTNLDNITKKIIEFCRHNNWGCATYLAR